MTRACTVRLVVLRDWHLVSPYTCPVEEILSTYSLEGIRSFKICKRSSGGRSSRGLVDAALLERVKRALAESWCEDMVAVMIWVNGE